MIIVYKKIFYKNDIKTFSSFLMSIKGKGGKTMCKKFVSLTFLMPILAILFFSINAYSKEAITEIPGINIPSVKTRSCQKAIIFNESTTISDTEFDCDIYINKGIVVTVNSKVTFNKPVYIFGELNNTGRTIFNSGLFCLNASAAANDLSSSNLVISNGLYDFGYFNSDNGTYQSSLKISSSDDYLLSGIPMIVHNFGYWTADLPAFCGVPGSDKRTCDDCGFIEYKDTEALTHSYNWKTTKKPTCLIAGTKAMECVTCFKISETQTIAKMGHSFSRWQTNKKVTIFNPGTKERKCSSCSITEKQSIKKLSAKVSLNKTKLSLEKGMAYALRIKKKTSNDKLVRWTSSNPKIVSVNKKTGKIKAKKKGTAYITVKMKSGAKAKCNVIIK